MRLRFVFLTLLSLASSASAIAGQDVEFRLSTPRGKYFRGERIVVTTTWKNVSKKTLLLERWRGLPQAVVPIGANGKALQYQGGLACGGPRVFFRLRPGEGQSETHEISRAYQMFQKGTYSLGSTFQSQKGAEELSSDAEYWVGTITAPIIRIEIAEADHTVFVSFREKARAGDQSAVQFLGINKDVGAVSSIEAGYKDSDWYGRYAIAEALGRIGTNEAIQAMKRLSNEASDLERSVLIENMAASHNPVAVPILREYLSSTDVGARTREQSGKSYKIFGTRKAAAEALRVFGINVAESVWKVPVDGDYRLPDEKRSAPN